MSPTGPVGPRRALGPLVAGVALPRLLAPLAALVALIFALAATAGLRKLHLPDEGRYVGVAREMLLSGDWLTPTLNGLPYFHKPPLFYWITTASMSVFGINEWAARTAPVLGGALAAGSLGLFLRRWAGERMAALAQTALLAQPMFFIGAQFANLDMLVAGCIAATLLLLADAALRVERGLPWQGGLMLAYAMAAAGVLAKGLIGVVIPALVIGAWLIVLRRWRLLRALLSGPGLLLFAALAMPWFALMEWRHPGFLDYFFVVQHFRRFTSGGFNNVQPVWFLVVALPLLSLPGLPWLVRGVLAPAPAAWREVPVRLLMGLWLTGVVAFFSIPQSKLLGYLLPALPPLAALMAHGLLARGGPSPGLRRAWAASLVVGAALGLGAVAWLARWPPKSMHALGPALQKGLRPGEPVVLLRRYDFDLAFYARLRDPLWVVEDWGGPAVQRGDNWRKALADAGRFNPRQAARVLITPEALPARLCRAPVAWIVTSARTDEWPAFLKGSRPVFVSPLAALWRVDTREPGLSRALACEGSSLGG